MALIYPRRVCPVHGRPSPSTHGEHTETVEPRRFSSASPPRTHNRMLITAAARTLFKPSRHLVSRNIVVFCVQAGPRLVRGTASPNDFIFGFMFHTFRVVPERIIFPVHHRHVALSLGRMAWDICDSSRRSPVLAALLWLAIVHPRCSNGLLLTVFNLPGDSQRHLAADVARPLRHYYQRPLPDIVPLVINLLKRAGRCPQDRRAH